MEIKINKKRGLSLNRKGKLKQQFCIYSDDPCGDWCPHFREPNKIKSSTADEDVIILKLCNGLILSCPESKFIDER